MQPSLAERLADWTATHRTRYGAVALERAHAALLDTIACMLAGQADPATGAALRMLGRLGGGDALIIGTAARSTAPWAALVNGVSAHALDFDDNYHPLCGHASAVLAPALIALAEEEGRSGADLVDAYITGLELQAGIGRAVNPRHNAAGWHSTSTIGAIAAAGACARLLRLDAGRVRAAMSIACSTAGGTKQQFGSMMKPVHVGLAAQHGVLAARMAEAGIVGAPDALDGRWGFIALYAGERQAGEPEDRDDRLAIERYGLLAKRFPCCGAAHRTLDGIAALRERHRIVASDVERIETYLPRTFRDNLRFDRPQTEMEARFSMPYCATRVLETGDLALGDLTMARVGEQALAPRLERVVVNDFALPADDLEALSTVIVPTVIVLRSGDRLRIEIGKARGSAENPLSPDDMRRKFRDCCSFGEIPGDADVLLAATNAIFTAGDVRATTNALERGAGSARS
jgi:2-methylcitrate dehydratase PrpD